ncbi:tetratricopeptide repeat-containing sensor histidine kinase [Fulvivirga lutimaris]|uniref:tetratricopeptide repeat-containing sensor histidine kinase n=1 Tax=Fulvivirga lutimaris TaxID=1819566 RepID=UPI0012BBBA7B|nr:sensor histidine kinase [Fulvivirga lutimaris]MTI39655.1 tetratricopeptide repeat protein [Fulvivirga lutimaris]
MEKAQNQFSSVQDTLGLANVLVNIASLENSRGNYILSFKIYQEAISFYQSINEAQGIIKVYVNLGNQQLKLNNFNEALSYYLKAEEYSVNSQNDIYLAYIYNGLGSIFLRNEFENKNLDEAEKYLSLALDIFEKTGNVGQAGSVINNLSRVYKERGEFSKAIDSYSEYIKLGLNRNSNSALLEGYHNLAILYKEMGEYNLALENLENAEDKAISISDPVNYIHILSNLVDVHMSIGNLQLAQDYLTKYKVLRDSIYDDEKIESLNELQVKYQTKEKEELLAKEIQVSEQRKLRNIFLSIFIFVLVVAIGVIIWLNKKRRVQELMVKQKELEYESLKASLVGQEQERTRLASDLHDSVGGVLTAVRMMHSSYKRDVGEKGQRVDELLEEAAKTVREVSHNLSSNTLERYGIVKSIEQAINALPDNLEVNYEANIPEDQLTEETKKSVDYIVKELLTNTVRHAKASTIDLELNIFEGTLLITYEDDGKGFNNTLVDDGIGLSNIRKRVALLKGLIDISTREGEGFVCSIEIKVN